MTMNLFPTASASDSSSTYEAEKEEEEGLLESRARARPTTKLRGKNDFVWDIRLERTLAYYTMRVYGNHQMSTTIDCGTKQMAPRSTDVYFQDRSWTFYYPVCVLMI